MLEKASRLEWVTTPDGFKLRTVTFTSTKRPHKGTIVLLHGRNEALEKYDHVFARLVSSGFDVVSFDWRGQGRSTRFFKDVRRGHVDHFEQYATDIETVFTGVALPDTRPPFHLLAHSTGALAALYTAPRLINRLKRIVLASPLLSLADRRLTTEQLHTISSAFCFLGAGKMYAGGGPVGSRRLKFPTNLLTTDLDTFERNRELLLPEKGLGLGGPTFGWVRAVTDAIATVLDHNHLAQIHIPTLLIGAGGDRIVSASAIEDYASRLRSGALVMVDGAKHELMQEAPYYREQFFAAFNAFVPGDS
ncbi:MAG: alpha/beta hydrolase [Pseudomonadota bacterium]